METRKALKRCVAYGSTLLAATAVVLIPGTAFGQELPPEAEDIVIDTITDAECNARNAVNTQTSAVDALVLGYDALKTCSYLVFDDSAEGEAELIPGVPQDPEELVDLPGAHQGGETV